MKKLILALTTLAACLVALPVPAANALTTCPYVVNKTFESGTADWAVLGGTLTQDSTVAHGGVASALATKDGGSAEVFYTPLGSVTAQACANYTMTFTGYVKGAGNFTPRLSFYDSAQAGVGSAVGDTQAASSADWTSFSVTLKVPPSALHAQLLVDSTGTINLDDINLTQVKISR